MSSSRRADEGLVEEKEAAAARQQQSIKCVKGSERTVSTVAAGAPALPLLTMGKAGASWSCQQNGLRRCLRTSAAVHLGPSRGEPRQGRPRLPGEEP